MIGGAAVLELLDRLPAEFKYHLRIDNYFTSLQLVEEMSRRGQLITGTIRKDRLDKCPLPNMGKKNQKGEMASYLKQGRDPFVVGVLTFSSLYSRILV